jgi:hypothetical protein
MTTLALVAMLSLASAGTAGGAPTPFVVSAGFSPPTIHYGDPVTAVVDVHFDPRRIARASIRPAPSFGPFVLVARPVVEDVGSSLVRFRYSLLCVTEGCLPVHASKVIRLKPLRVTAGGGSATTSWQPLRVVSRLHPSDLRGEAPFRSPDAPPPPRYRVGPGGLATGLIAAAALCTLGAVGLLIAAVRRRRRRPVTRRASPLELAIAYVRDSTGRPAPDRRRALELLSEAADDDLAPDAADAAWSRHAPTPAAAGELADRAEGRP